MSKITIAIDGYSACGKSTLAKALAAHLGYAYIDSGAMYRCVALYAIRKEIIKDGSFEVEDIVKILTEVTVSFEFNPKTKTSDTLLNGENVERAIRQMDVSESVSLISSIHEVRVKMVALQREFGKGGGIVMDGRDIGSHVFPDAEMKIFMTADTEVRTQRRYDEFKSKGQKIEFKLIQKNLLKRDYEDINRKENPLVQAKKAIVLDNSDLSREQQLAYILKLMKDLIPASFME